MSLSLGSTSIGSLYLGSTKIGAGYLGNVKVYESTIALPSYTIRLQFTDGVTPSFSKGTAVQVSSSPNVWDLTYINNGKTWMQLLDGQTQLLSVLAANSSGIRNMVGMFNNCNALTRTPIFDTSSVTNMDSMFDRCSSLTSVPLLNTSKVTNVTNMFNNCNLVETGARALYQQMSSQTTPPSSHTNCFSNCGRDTTTGAAELSQIPSDWGGTAT